MCIGSKKYESCNFLGEPMGPEVNLMPKPVGLPSGKKILNGHLLIAILL